MKKAKDSAAGTKTKEVAIAKAGEMTGMDVRGRPVAMVDAQGLT